MLELVHRAVSDRKFERNIWCICVFRDEEALLPHFIRYYAALGVTHFLMVDNVSADAGVSYLKAISDVNLCVYRAEGEYRSAAYGMSWVNDLLLQHCQGDFCFVVDADELFLLDKRRFASLHELIESMEAAGANTVAAHLVDMYPRSMRAVYSPGSDFLSHSAFFDDWNAEYYALWHEIYGGFRHKVGGVRRRVFRIDVCLHKFPFFRYDFAPLRVAPGCHYFQDGEAVLKNSALIRLHAHASVLLHFKFLKPDFEQVVARRVRNNQDWNESAEYRSYLRAIELNGGVELFDGRYSREFHNSADLDAFFSAIS